MLPVQESLATPTAKERSKQSARPKWRAHAARVAAAHELFRCRNRRAAEEQQVSAVSLWLSVSRLPSRLGPRVFCGAPSLRIGHHRAARAANTFNSATHYSSERQFKGTNTLQLNPISEPLETHEPRARALDSTASQISQQKSSHRMPTVSCQLPLTLIQSRHLKRTPSFSQLTVSLTN